MGKPVRAFTCATSHDVLPLVSQLLFRYGGVGFRGNIYVDATVVVMGDRPSLWEGMQLGHAQTPKGFIDVAAKRTLPKALFEALDAPAEDDEEIEDCAPDDCAHAASESEEELHERADEVYDLDEPAAHLSAAKVPAAHGEGAAWLSAPHEDVAAATMTANRILLDAHERSARIVSEANERLFTSIEQAHQRLIDHSIDRSDRSMAALREQGLALQNTVSEINLRVAEERLYNSELAAQEERARTAHAMYLARQHAPSHPEQPSLLARLAQGLMFSWARTQQRKLAK